MVPHGRSDTQSWVDPCSTAERTFLLTFPVRQVWERTPTMIGEPAPGIEMCRYGTNQDYDSSARLLVDSEWPGKSLPEPESHAVPDRLPVTLLAIADQTVVGCGSVVLRVSRSSLRLSTCVCDLVVRRDYRNRGIASKIVEELTSHPLRPPTWTCLASTKQPNLFLRLGWVAIGTLEEGCT